MIDNNDDNDDGALSPRLRALLDQGGAGPPVPPAVRDRLLGKVLVSVGAATVVAASTAAATTTTTAAGATTATAATTTATVSATAAAVTKAVVLKVGLGLVAVGVVGVVGGGVVVATRPAATSTTMNAAATGSEAASVGRSDVVVDDHLTPQPPLQQVGEGEENTPSIAPPPDRAGRPLLPLSTASPGERRGEGAGGEVGNDVAARSGSIAREPTTRSPTTPVAAVAVDEAALLERARSALANADPTAALAAVDEHARSAPGGQLVEEREALRVIALARAGRADDARVAGDAFLLRWPSSLLADRVRAVIR